MYPNWAYHACPDSRRPDDIYLLHAGGIDQRRGHHHGFIIYVPAIPASIPGPDAALELLWN